MPMAESCGEQTRARWEAGEPVRDAARLAVLVTGHDYRHADMEAGR
jgi:hypothetical protein